MTEAEALELRKNGSKLYNHVRVAFYAAIECALDELRKYNLRFDRDEIQHFVDSAWDATNLDDTFHALGSQGYRQLIRDGWNPFEVIDPNDWQPSPDCIDHPTTKGGADE